MTIHSINIPIDGLGSWGISEETYKALMSALKFRFIIGDRGNIYDVRAYVNKFGCTSWYWEFKVHILKNFKLQLHYEHCLRIPVFTPISPDIVVGMTERYLEDTFRSKIMIETIQPEDFYE